MKIYFCGSIKGGREKVDFYHEIIDELKNFGEVLTEHVGNRDYGVNGYKDSTQVYLQDTTWLLESDIVIAEITVPSLGVGYELAYAEKNHKKVFCFYEKQNEEKISSMIKGDEYFALYPYNNIEEVKNIIKEIFSNL